MKKNLLTLTFIIFSGLLFTISIKADNFEDYLSCPTGYVPYDDPKILYQVSKSSSEESVKNYFKENLVCLNPDKIGAIMDAWGSFKKFTLYLPGMYFCPIDSTVGYDDTISGYTDFTKGGLTGGYDLCCPKNYEYIRWGVVGGNYACCANDRTGLQIDTPRDSLLRISDEFPVSCGRNSSGVDIGGKKPTKAIFDMMVISPDQYMTFNNTPAYYCPTDSCFAKVDSSQKYAYVRLSIAGGQTKSGRSVDRKIDGKCETALIDDYGVFCVEGGKVTEEEYNEFLKIGSSAQKACEDFVDSEEEAACLNCYNTCPEKGTCSYSSLGCIETTKNGLIVRFFQIGLGIVGAFAIVRFIQAALLRQTADPSKIQESYDIITSIIIGLVVLLGSMVILKFIGVDVLQIIPFDFFK